jgi:protein SDA1
MTSEEREKLKQELSSTRIFSAEDFAKMRKLLDREERAKHDPREKARRKRAIAAGQDFEALSDDSDEEDDEDRGVNVKGTVDPEDIMAAATRKRQSKAEKLKKIIAGRTKFETKAREGGSTNIEKKRTKNFVMSKFSHDARSKGTGKSNRKRKKKDMKLKSSHESKKRRRKV